MEALAAHEPALLHAVAVGMVLNGVAAALTLAFVNAPYGRYSAPKGWGPLLDARLAWVLMESPNLLWALSNWSAELPLPNRVLLGAFALHYVNRTVVYPLRTIRGSKKMPASVCFLAWLFCACNGFLQARSLAAHHAYPARWHRSPQFLAGLALFACGMAVNVHSDEILRGLRGPGETGYRIPRGGLFELVSGANFLGEIVEWTGYAVAANAPFAAAFAAFTALNIGPRALQHHAHYRRKFDDYPARRRALVPFLL